MKIFICGFSGSGKSRLGQKLSKHPTFQVFDLDEEILNRNGGGHDHLGEYIDEVGLDVFREDELDMVKLLDANFKDNYMIILGAGALERPSLESYIKQCGAKLVYLESTFDQCWSRIEQSHDRPLVKKGRKFMEELYEKRRPLYQKADVTLTNDQVSKIDSVEDLISFLG